jgi:hypothetical protein
LDGKHSVTVSLNQGSGRIEAANCGVDPGGSMVEESRDYRLADAPIRSCDQRYLVFDIEYYFQFCCSWVGSKVVNRSHLRMAGRDLSDMSFHYILKNRVI